MISAHYSTYDEIQRMFPGFDPLVEITRIALGEVGGSPTTVNALKMLADSLGFPRHAVDEIKLEDVVEHRRMLSVIVPSRGLDPKEANALLEAADRFIQLREYRQAWDELERLREQLLALKAKR